MLALSGRAMAAATVDTAQPFYDENSPPLAQNPIVFDGGTFRPTNVYATGTPVVLDSTGGFIDSSNGVVRFIGNITGSGALTVQGSYGVNLYGSNSYTGATIVESSTVAFGSFNALPGDLQFQGYGQASFQLFAAKTYSGVISGSNADVALIGAAPFTLTGDNTASGRFRTFTNNLTIGDGATHGAWAGDITTSATVTFDRSDTITFGGVISNGGNPGAVEMKGGGTLVLTGANSYTGATTIDSGSSIQLGDGTAGHDGSISPASAIVDSGTLKFDYSGTGSFANTISGSGSAEIVGGTVVVTGLHNVGGTVTIDSGATLQWGDGSTDNGWLFGGGTAVTDNGALVVDNAPGGSISGGIQISGSGSLEVKNGGLGLSAAETYTGQTKIDAGASLFITGSGSISGSSDVLDNGAFDISLATNDQSIKSLSGSGTVNLGGRTLSLTAATGTFSGGISGAGGLHISGGTETLTGSNSYSGATTIDSGSVLQLGDGTSGHNGTVSGSISDNGTLKLDYSGTGSFANTISGSGSAEIVGGTVVVTGLHNIGGTVTIDSGATLQWGDGSTSNGWLFGGGTAVTDNGALVVDNAPGGSISGGIQISGSGSLEIKNGGLGLSAAETYTGQTKIDAGASLFITGSGSISGSSDVLDNGAFDISLATNDESIKSLSGSGTVNLGGRTLSLTAATGTFSGGISGTGGLHISGGTETLTGTNTFSGATTIDSGAVLQLGDGTSGHDGAVAGNITDNGTLKFDYFGPEFFDNAISGSGSVEIVAGVVVVANLDNVGGTVTIDSGATLQWGDGVSNGWLYGAGVAVTDNGALIVQNAPGGSISGSFLISGSGRFEVENGAVGLGVAETYTGETQIDASGTLYLFNTGSISSSSEIIDNGSFDIAAAASDQSIKSLIGSGTVILGGHTLSLTAASGTFLGGISGSGGLHILSGTEALGGVNSYSGATTIDAGATLDLTGSGSIANSADPLVNGTLDISGHTGGVSVQSLSGSGKVKLGSNTLTLTHASETFSGVISGSGGLTISGGTETLSGINTYTGATSIDDGAKLVLSGSGSIAKTSGLVDDGTFDIHGITASSATIATLSGSGNVALGAKTLTLANADGTFSGVISGSGGLHISGGTETLTGTNTYTGATTIAGGAVLQLGHGKVGHDGTVAGSITDDGTLKLDYSGTEAFNNAISGGGSVEIVAGTVVVANLDSVGGTVTIDSGATLQWGDGVANNGWLYGGGVAVTDNGALVVDNEPGGSISGGFHISGSGSLEVKNGALGLTTAETYTGQTKIDAGASLYLINSGSISSSSDVIDNGSFDISPATSDQSITTLSGAGTVNLGGNTLSLTAAAGTFSGGISGSGGLHLLSGTETLSGVNTYTGITTIDLGATLKISGAGSIAESRDPLVLGTFDISGASGAVPVMSLSGTGSVILGGNTLMLTQASEAFDGVISGSGGLTIAGGTEVLRGTNTYTGSTTIDVGASLALAEGGSIALSKNVADNGIFDISGANDTPVPIKSLSGSGLVNLGSNTLDITQGAQTFTGGIAGSGGLTISGGTEGLGGDNSYTGPTTIDPGATLKLVGNGSIRHSSVVADNGTFDVSGDTTLDSIISLAGGGQVLLGAKTLTLTHAHNVFSGHISGTGGLTLAGGTETLTGVSSYSGTTLINAGAKLRLSGQGSISNSRVDDNGTLDISGASGSRSIRSLAGGGLVTLGSGSLTLTQASDTFSGVISGSGGFNVAAGTETLSGADTYTGATGIASGATLKLAGAGSIAGSSNVADEGTFDVSGASGGVSIKSLSGSGGVSLGGNGLTLTAAGGDFSGVISGTGGLTVTGGGEVLTGTNSYTGLTTIGSGAALQLGDGGSTGTVASDIVDSGVLIFDYGSAKTYAGVVTGSGATVVVGPGPLTLTGNNTYAGATVINAGAALKLGAGGTSGSVAGDILDNGALTFNRSDTVTENAAIAGTGSLTQAGAGKLILNGVDTVSGQTTVAAGTLEVGDAGHPGAVLDSHLGGVLVASGATLGGHGAILGAVTNNGVVAPGGTIGTLTVASYTQGSGGALTIEVGPAAASQLKVIGAASLAGTLNLNFDAGTYTPQVFDIVTAGSLSGTFSTINRNGAPAGFVYGVGYTSGAVVLIGAPTANAEVYGEVSAATLDRAQSFAGMVEDSFGQAVCASGANTPHDGCNGMLAWAKVIGSSDHVDATASGYAFTNKGAGALGGLQKDVGQDAALGVAFGYTENNLHIGAAETSASGRSYYLSAYARLASGPLQLDGQGFWMKTDWPLRRVVQGVGTASSNPNGDSEGFLAQASTALGASGLRGYVRFTYAHFRRDAVSEAGVGLFGYNVQGGASNAAVGEAGVIYDPASVAVGQATVFPTLRLGVQEDFSSRGIPIAANLGNLAGTDFTSTYTRAGRTTGVADAAIRAQVSRSFDLTAEVRGRLGSGQTEGAATVGGVIHF